MRSLLGGSAAYAAALLTSTVFLCAGPLTAETATSEQNPSQQQQPEPALPQKENLLPPDLPGSPNPGEAASSLPLASSTPRVDIYEEPPAMPPAPQHAGSATESYVATAYSLGGRTASGRPVSKGLIAADPLVLPFGTRVRLEAGSYSGEYTVADAGGSVRGRRIDVWVPNGHEASRFGRRSVKLTVLSYGARRTVRNSTRRRRH